MNRRGPQPGVYLWRGKTYIGQRAVAKAAGVSRHVVSYHLWRNGHLDNLGIGHVSGWPAGGNRRAVSKFGREWPSIAALAREIGRPVQTVQRWIAQANDDRLLAALMAADARKTAAAMREAQMIDGHPNRRLAA